MQKKVLPLLPYIQYIRYRLFYETDSKHQISYRSIRQGYKQYNLLYIRCLPPPPLTFIYILEATTYTAGSTRRAAFGVSSAVWGGQV